MDAGLWLRVSTAFSTAEDLPKDELDGFLRSLSEDVRVEVLSLLQANDNAGAFLEPNEDWLANGTTLDRFVIDSLVARGGMGEVYRAHRKDSPEAQVAVKVLSPMFATREAARLFSRERKILAQLSHSDIVTFIDSGETLGRPYFVMEWVEGVRLDHWARTASLDEKLALFERVCAAVHSAHQGMVVHCDLKPSNILVTSTAEPKLLDFGIARLLTSTGDLPVATRTSLRVLTLNYASPEQARDLPAGIPSDVYSLGLIFYELLTGKMAQMVEGLPLDEAIAAITQKELDYKADLPSDLVAIVRKATAKEVSRRYASVSEFAADIARFRSGYPVLARNPTLGYQARLFVRRNRTPVIVGVIGLLAVLLALSAFVFQFQTTRKQKTLAERRFRVAREMAQLMVFDGPARLANVPGTLETRRWMTEKAVSYLESLSADIQGDESLALVVAQGYRQVAYQQFNFNQAHLNNAAGALLNLERAALVLEAIPNPGARVLAELIENRLNRPYLVLRRRKEAMANEDAAETLVNQLENKAFPKHKDIQAQVRYRRASNFDRPADERLKLWVLLEKYYLSKVMESPSDSERMRNLALVHKNVSDVYGTRKEFPLALEHALKALQLDERRMTMAPGDSGIMMDISFDLGRVGQVHGLAGRPQNAIPFLRRAVSIRTDISAKDPADLRAQERVAWMLGELGRRLLEAKLSQEGLVKIREALAIRTRLKSPGAGQNSTPDLHALLAFEAERTGAIRSACIEWKEAARTLPPDTSWSVDQTMPIAKIRERAATCP